MSDSILQKQIVVKLNANWQGFDVLTVAKAVTFLCSENNGEKPGFALDYETAVDENGETVFISDPVPVAWEDWVKLPVRECDFAIGIGPDPITGQPRSIRAPLVVVCSRYKKLPQKRPRVSAGTIRERDGGVCQYTGRKLSAREGNLDHIYPRSRGGKDSFENLVWADRAVNSLKGDRTPEEAGLKLIRKPVAPKAMVKVLHASDARHPSQVPFLLK